MSWQDRLEDLKKRIAENEKILIAYSGGVDSSLLAKVATDVLGENALCVILDTETMPRSELQHAIELAKSMGLNYRLVKYSMLEDGEFIENPPERCYICKKVSSKRLKKVASENGISVVADGVNLSDCKDYRPGIRACNEEGIWHPFFDSQISKEDIREIARTMGLPFWDKPSSACLSSRIPYGEKITEENLRMVEEAEDLLKSLGFCQLRVRAHGRIARIEVLSKDMDRTFGERNKIVEALKRIGFEYVTLDLEGFRSGSMNEVLWTSQR